jgi:nucleoid DNA-binding protein/nucleoid-associated protein YgaU
MDKKLLLQDLVDKLSTVENLKKKEAEEFLRNYFKVLEEGLLQDRMAKINGLGTFKLIEVEARNSVDVNTGQPFQIKEHLKLNFIPDVNLKDLINKPFAAFEPIEMNEEIQPEETEVTIKTPQSMVEDVTDDSHINQTDMDNLDEKKGEIPEIEPDDMEEMPEMRRRGMGSSGKFMLVFLLILAIGGLAYWALRSNNDARKDQDQKIGIIQRFKELFSKDSKVILPDTLDQDILFEEVTDSTAIYSAFPDTTRQYPVYVNLNAGNRLTLLALEYYGHKVFWVYIYLDNKDVIENPNDIPVGTKLRISKPHLKMMDPNNPEAIRKATALQYRIQNKFN